MKRFLFQYFIFLFIADASHAQHSFDGLVLDGTANKYQNSISIGIKKINKWNDTVVVNTHYSFQVCPFFLDWTYSDPYNGNSANISTLSAYNWAWLSVFAF